MPDLVYEYFVYLCSLNLIKKRRKPKIRKRVGVAYNK